MANPIPADAVREALERFDRYMDFPAADAATVGDWKFIRAHIDKLESRLAALAGAGPDLPTALDNMELRLIDAIEERDHLLNLLFGSATAGEWIPVKPEGAPYWGIHTADGRTVAGTSSGLSEGDAKLICALREQATPHAPAKAREDVDVLATVLRLEARANEEITARAHSDQDSRYWQGRLSAYEEVIELFSEAAALATFAEGES